MRGPGKRIVPSSRYRDELLEEQARDESKGEHGGPSAARVSPAAHGGASASRLPRGGLLAVGIIGCYAEAVRIPVVVCYDELGLTVIAISDVRDETA
jgi:hypothetical protein